MSGFGSARSKYQGGVTAGNSGLKLAANTIDARALGDRALRYVYDEFRAVDGAKLGGGAAGGTAGDVNLLRSWNAFNMHYEYAIVGTQTITVPVLKPVGQSPFAATAFGGIDIGLDQTLNDGLEIIFGAQHSGVGYGRLAFKAQSDASIFAKWTLAIEDVSGIQLLCGLKKAIAFGAVSTYTDYALMGITATADADGTINTQTRLASGSVVTTDTGKDWADLGQHTIALTMSQNGAVTFYWDGERLATPPTFTFASGNMVVPFLRATQLTDLSGLVILQRFESSFIAPQGS